MGLRSVYGGCMCFVCVSFDWLAKKRYRRHRLRIHHLFWWAHERDSLRRGSARRDSIFPGFNDRELVDIRADQLRTDLYLSPQFRPKSTERLSVVVVALPEDSGIAYARCAGLVRGEIWPMKTLSP